MQGQGETATRGLFLAAGGLFGFLGVASGAFAAHALKGSLKPEAMGWLATASQYWLVHAVALVAMAAVFSADPKPGGKLLRWAGWGMIVGVLVFSGSLALLALGGPRFLIWATPLGGSLLLLAWLSLLGAGMARLRA